MIKKFVNFISYSIVPLITLDKYAPNVALWNIAFLNWHYLNKSMINASEHYIKGICLDIGSGNSPYKKYLKVAKYISIDKDDTQAVSYQNNTHSINADAKNLPLEDKYADTILLNQVLEHIYEYEMVLDEINRVLKDDGKFILSIPFLYHIHAEPNDYFRFSEYGIKNLLKQKGFKVIRFEYNGYAGTALVSIFNGFLWQVWNKHLLLKLLRNTLFLVPLLSVFLLNNLLGLFLDLFKNEKFCPNYFIVCEKNYEQL